MPKYLAAIDLAKNELRNARVQNLATAPGSPVAGQIYFDSSLGNLYFYDGTQWLATYQASAGASGAAGGDLTGTYPNPTIAAGAITDSKVAAGAAIQLSKLAVNPLARANHTGTQLAATISDFDTQVRTSRLDQMAAPTANVSYNGQRITSLADPVGPQDAATKNYVDAAALGLDVKQSVRAASAGSNLTLSGNQTVDGVVLVTGDRILVKDQTDGTQNGIYLVAAGAWTRTTDANSAATVTPGLYTFVEQGTANADSGFILTNDGTITLGTTALAFAQFTGAGQITAGAGLTKTGNTIDAIGASNRITVFPDYIDIAATYAGQTSITTLGTITTGTWNATPIGIAYGGTAATNQTAARSNLGAVGTTFFQNGGTTSDTYTHNLGTLNIIVQAYEISSGAMVYPDVVAASSNSVTVSYATAPAAGTYRVVIHG